MAECSQTEAKTSSPAEARLGRACAVRTPPLRPTFTHHGGASVWGPEGRARALSRDGPARTNVHLPRDSTQRPPGCRNWATVRDHMGLPYLKGVEFTSALDLQSYFRSGSDTSALAPENMTYQNWLRAGGNGGNPRTTIDHTYYFCPSPQTTHDVGIAVF